MKTIKVPSIHCENCSRRIKAAFAEEGIKGDVNASEKTVTFDEGKEDAVREILDDLGFDVE